MDGIVGMVFLDLDRPDSKDEVAGLGGSAVLVGGSVARAWCWDLAEPAECLAGRRQVVVCLVGHYLVVEFPVGHRPVGAYLAGPWAA